MLLLSRLNNAKGDRAVIKIRIIDTDVATASRRQFHSFWVSKFRQFLGIASDYMRESRRFVNEIRHGALILLALLLTGCAWHLPADRKFTPEAPAPDPVRISQLMKVTAPPSGKPRAFFRLSAPFVFAGQSVNLSCFVPHTPEFRALLLGIPGVELSAQSSHFRDLAIAVVPCGTLIAICDALGPGGRVLTHQEQPLESRGQCNDGGGTL